MMSRTRRLVGALALLGGFAAFAPATAQTTVLKYSNWLPAGQAMRVEVIEPWIAEVEKATQGRVKIDTLPKVVGTLPAQFDVARDGQADLVVFIPGYTPNRFDILEVLQMPFISDNPEVLAPIADRFYRKHLASYGEFKGVHPLSVYVVSPGQLFNAKRPLRSIADFKGLKFRSPQPSATQALTLLGAVPVNKPVSETYELLSSGVLDGTLMPPESIPAFKLNDQVNYATIVPGAIYNTVLVLGINEDKWKSLRAEDRDAIMRISGEAFAARIGQAYAKGDRAAFDGLRKAGKTVEVLPEPALAEMKKVLQPVEKDWIEKARKKGVADPQKLLAQVRAEVAAANGGK
ncbi:TRAP transporter substrate-binding protein [Ramlibacter tataouinensis]|uniref:TRAP transporter substrate-binding protein n=1 Tax=Ramlibacter tataouinensis TaxID=94132 RepID=UPI0022F3F3BF|nr:TRAP transporter substrate-binding protein [Ramlibacter tataouinensis]WBY03055.1 TRAP transporter substrate-binding protein [Ramlibacter tataouinensis]